MNVLWGFTNLLIAYLLLKEFGGGFNIRNVGDVLIAGAGALVMSVFCARAFGRFHSGE